MYSTSIYAPIHGTNDHVLASLSASQGRKRRRGSNDSGDLVSEDESPDTPSSSRAPPSPAELFASAPPSQLGQHDAAGLEPGAAMREHLSPHRSAIPLRTTHRDVQSEFVEINPPLAHISSVQNERSYFKTDNTHESLREKHLQVLTTVLHTMLLKRDYHRAGRAWGLLLRSGYMAHDVKSRVGARSMDVRTNERWGIGAEILIRRGDERKSQLQYDEHSDTKQPEFSAAGFCKARQYYERLIVQYSEHRRRKGAKASAFYVAMFSLWIYEVVEKSKVAKAQLSKEIDSQVVSSFQEPDGNSNLTQRLVNPGRLRIQREELEGAREVASRLDDILVLPGFDRNAELLQLRGMIALWISKLGPVANQGREIKKAKSSFAHAEKYDGDPTPGLRDLIRISGTDGNDGSASDTTENDETFEVESLEINQEWMSSSP